jgi:hypothetical protein
LENDICRARQKAEGLLLEEVSDISFAIKKGKKEVIFRPHWDLVPLRFEAHAYLAHKYPGLKSEYSEELRSLWMHWIKAQNNNEQEIQNVFYSDDPCWGIWETAITMLRVWEILEIQGFRRYFCSSLEKLREFLINPPIHFPGEGPYEPPYETFWLIFRSVTIQRSLNKLIQNAAEIVLERINKYSLNELIEDLDLQDRANEFRNWINGVIFLAISGKGEDYSSSLKRAADQLIFYQNNDGSLLNDTFATCSFALAINLAKIDSTRSIQQKALKWLLQKQNINGSWDFQMGFWGFSVNVNYQEKFKQVLSTVIVLEVIDLIMDNKPLPPWTQADQCAMPPRDAKPSTVQEETVFPMQEGTSWKEIAFYFINDEEAEVLISGKSQGVKNFITLGFKDKRDKKGKFPDRLWKVTLISLAKAKGALSIKEDDLDEKDKVQLRKSMSRLRRRLQEIFGIKDDPFFPFWNSKSYKAKFAISYRESVEDESHEPSDIERVFKDDIERMETRERKNVLREWVKDIKGKKDTQKN